jgi:6-phosphogluconolactonase
VSAPLVVVHRDATLLAQAVAARIITAIVDAQAVRGEASIVLTGGGIGGATLRELAEAPARAAIDWSQLSIWWGDERFLPTGHPDRNETQAREALLNTVDVDPKRVHAMPASDGPLGDDLDAAAQAYAAELAAAAEPGGAGPSFDVLLLGLGPEGHVASLFPDAPALTDDRAVIPVRGCPKPPPTRISLSMSTINTAREAWLIAAGEEKAGAVRLALSGASASDVPAAGVNGRDATRWLLDRAAASQLPD